MTPVGHAAEQHLGPLGCVSGPLNLPWEGAFTEGIPELSWAANNSAKMQANRSPAHSQEVWTIISSREFGAAHKVSRTSVCVS